MEKAYGILAFIALYWHKAKALVAEFPGYVLVLWFLSFILGVWL